VGLPRESKISDALIDLILDTVPPSAFHRSSSFSALESELQPHLDRFLDYAFNLIHSPGDISMEVCEKLRRAASVDCRAHVTFI
jgi:hypothetical protein